MSDQGFIKLSRKFFKNPLWKEPRQYSRSEAWLDLIFMARFEDSQQILRNRVIEVQRGEIIASRRFLEERWSWGSTKVVNFLNYLQNNGMVNQRQTSGQTIIILCNYDTYNPPQTSGYDKNKPVTNQSQTSDKPVTNQNKEYKEREESKEGKENNISPLSPIGDIPPGESVPEEKNDNPKGSNQQEPKKEKSSAKKERKVFVPPSVDEVTQYCKENGYTVNPVKFVSYYTSNGWMVGRNKMQDWKAAVITWQSNGNNYGERQLSANNQICTGRNNLNTARTDAENKRAERANLNQMALAILRETPPPEGG